MGFGGDLVETWHARGANVLASRVGAHPESVCCSGAENASRTFERPDDFWLRVAIDVAPERHVTTHIGLDVAGTTANDRTICKSEASKIKRFSRDSSACLPVQASKLSHVK